MLVGSLLRFFAALLPVSLASQRLLRPALLTGLQIEGVLLDLFDDVFLLHFALESAQGAFQSLTLLDVDFSQL